MGKGKSVIEKLKEFAKKVSGEIPIKQMILFGSRAEGKTGRDRDIDLIIVSPKFRGMDFFSRGAMMYDYWDLNYPVDFLCYTPEEFNKLKKMMTIVREAKKEGIVIK
jgi:hypothetical protein